jgi:hypothetical protein
MGVDLSRSIRSLLDGALERGRKLAAAGNAAQAAEAFDEAARLALQYAEYSSSPAEKKRRLLNAADYRARAEQLRTAPRTLRGTADGTPPGVPAAGPPSTLNEDAQQHAAAIEALVMRSTTTWEQIAGLEETKRSIMSAYALSLAQAPQGVLLTPVRNMLFYGPPGCGKSLLAAATSNGLDATFFNVKVSSLLSKYFGESPKLVADDPGDEPRPARSGGAGARRRIGIPRAATPHRAAGRRGRAPPAAARDQCRLAGAVSAVGRRTVAGGGRAGVPRVRQAVPRETRRGPAGARGVMRPLHGGGDGRQTT